MSLLGGNVSARGEISPDTIRDAGAQWARFVLLPTFDATTYMEALYRTGIDYLPVFARESWDGFTAPAEGMSHYAGKYGPLIHQIQVGNEPDADPSSGSSWIMSPGQFSSLLGQARNAFPDARIVTAGLVSGQPGWLGGVTLGSVDVIACHPYAKSPGSADLDYMLAGYAAYRKPVWCTEFDSRTRGMAPHLAQRTDVERAAVFCLHDYLDFGVLNRPDRLAEFRAAAGQQPAPIPQPAPEPSMPRFVLGFADVHAAHPDLVGDPVEDERGGIHGLSQQRTTRGLLTWADLGWGQAITFYEWKAKKRWIWDGSRLVESAA